MNLRKVNHTLLGVFNIAISVSTMFCCVVPTLLVTLGLGSVMALIVSHAVWLTDLSEYKFYLLACSGLIILLSSWLQREPADSCEVSCQLRKNWHGKLMAVAESVWFASFLMSYFALPAAAYLDSIVG